MRDAFDVKALRMAGPDWLDDGAYDVEALARPGASKEEVRGMLRNLLVERFGLKFHYETWEVAGYELRVAKTSPNLRRAAQADGSREHTATKAGQLPLQEDRNGIPELPPGSKRRFTLLLGDGKARISGRRQTAQEIASMCEDHVARLVVDRTALQGESDFNIDYQRQPTRPETASANAPFPESTSSSGEELR